MKYCFRYNARNRNIRITGEDGEPINLGNMPQHPRRRRREKKLMTIDEVDEKFPMMKYKSWVASRAQEGLPTRGGISQPPSRAGSLRDADGIIPVTKERDSIDDVPATGAASVTRTQTNDEPTSEHAEGEKKTADATAKPAGESTVTDGTTNHTTALARADSPGTDDEPDEDDQIHDALPPEALETSGDTCAICIDTLEDDDDVRGLTCGHAFHAVCLDPWLTSRRACCPLCKADYYTPKPRAPQAEGGPTGAPEIGPTVSIQQDSRTNRMNMPNRPGVAWIFSRRGGGNNSNNNSNGNSDNGASRFALPLFNRNNQNTSSSPANQTTSSRNNTSNAQRPSRIGGFMSRATTGPQQNRPTRNATITTTNNNSNNSQADATTTQTGGGFLSNIRIPRFGGRSTAGAAAASSDGNSTGNSNTEVTPSNLEAGVR